MIPESVITMPGITDHDPGIGDHVKSESVITIVRNTQIMKQAIRPAIFKRRQTDLYRWLIYWPFYRLVWRWRCRRGCARKSTAARNVQWLRRR